ncbi:MAG: AAA family ATPase [Magnetococcales bacterium]|nr:AAA family ATPase [Magnetococcales bacterium]
MYQHYFNFNALPFSISPDPRFFHLSNQHRDALAHLLYSVRGSSGFVLMTGEVGAGKTLLTRCLLEQLSENVDSALIFNPRLNPVDLVAAICDELGARYPKRARRPKVLFDALNKRLLQIHSEGRQAILIIDEAQNLDANALEQVRLLTNLETSETKLLQIILVGQPELAETLARPGLRQLSQRITATFHIPLFNRRETNAYVRHRLGLAGRSDALFTRSALNMIHHASQGTPRVINKLCDRALLGAYSLNAQRVNRRIARQAIRELSGTTPRLEQAPLGVWIKRWSWTLMGATLLLLLVRFSIPAQWDPHAWLTQLSWENQPQSAQPSLPSPTTKSSAQLSQASLPTETSAPKAASSLKSPPPPLPTPEPPIEEEVMVVESTPTLPVTDVTPQHEEHVEPARGATPSQPSTENAISSLEILTEEQLTKLIKPEEDGSDLERSVTTLAKLWQAQLTEKVTIDGCGLAASSRIQCVRLRGSWKLIRYLDRPVMIPLSNRAGQTIHVPLVGLNNHHAVLHMDGRRLKASLTMLESYWRKRELTLMWRVPWAGFRPLSYGLAGHDVQRFRQWLARFQKEPATITTNPEYFGLALKNMLIRFQNTHHLHPDGIAGPRTFMIMRRLENGGVVQPPQLITQ